MPILFSDGKNPVYMMLIVVMQFLAVPNFSNRLDVTLLRCMIVICSSRRGAFLIERCLLGTFRFSNTNLCHRPWLQKRPAYTRVWCWILKDVCVQIESMWGHRSECMELPNQECGLSKWMNKMCHPVRGMNGECPPRMTNRTLIGH